VQRSRTDMMRAYAQSNACRSQTLLAYFGEDLAKRCGHCDNCVDGVAQETEEDTTDELFAVHSTVRHAEWGPGMVMGYEEDRMTVLFEEVGYKTLSVPVVQEHALLVAEKNK
jgi:ATP-dependent DNA helicase RecQ